MSHLRRQVLSDLTEQLAFEPEILQNTVVPVAGDQFSISHHHALRTYIKGTAPAADLKRVVPLVALFHTTWAF